MWWVVRASPMDARGIFLGTSGREWQIGMLLVDFFRPFPDNLSAEAPLEAIRRSDGLVCPHCCGWRDPLRLVQVLCAPFVGLGLRELGGVWLLLVALLVLGG